MLLDRWGAATECQEVGYPHHIIICSLVSHAVRCQELRPGIGFYLNLWSTEHLCCKCLMNV